MNFINIKFDGKEYTLVDKYEELGKDIIYHFVGDDDEKFFIKKDNKYIEIKDENEINKIKEKLYFKIDGIYFYIQNMIEKINNLIKNESKEVKEEVRQHIIDEQIEKIEELENGIKREEINARLKNVRIFETSKMPEKQTQAFYKRDENTIYFKPEHIFKDDIRAKRIRLHEVIHAITGAKRLVKLEIFCGGRNDRSYYRKYS